MWMIWKRHKTCVGEMRNGSDILVGNGPKWHGYEGVYLFLLAQDMDLWRAFSRMVLKFGSIKGWKIPNNMNGY
jgi:hypothetical protein